jgi:ABC-2 type transport system ATP-binding protein
MLKITNLRKKYGDKTILDIDFLQLNPGIIHLKGVNGSGKTTFSKIISGLIPFEGKVVLNSTLTPDKTKIAYRRAVNYAAAEPVYPDFLTGDDLISFVGKAKSASKEDFNLLPELFGINSYQADAVGTYSSGMLKRLSLCLAFLGNPSLIVLDEPFNTMDTQAVDLLINMIETRHKNGINFLLVSHQDIGSLGIKPHESYLCKNHNITILP